MNEFEKKKCLELTNKMHRMDLCKPFKEKVDPVRDGAPDYFQIVKRPMDLTTIRKKLNSNDYRSIDLWVADVNQVWTNAMLYNNEGTLIYVIAQEMEIWFKKKFESMPRNKDEEWMEMLRKSTKKMFDLARNPPSSIAGNRSTASLFTALQQTTLPPPPETQITSHDTKLSIKIPKQQNKDASKSNSASNQQSKSKSNSATTAPNSTISLRSPQRSQSFVGRPLSTPPEAMRPQSPTGQSQEDGEKGDEVEKAEDNPTDAKTQETTENEEEPFEDL
ncbi:Bromodomain containing protein [Tritrichomonas foetus]|uniref:Bromodomain containing protein n=1 Tax=Tritrichomonas foetus TaxID=1144522 RepID=A0A1J4K892_9EUKA|nr:Bromodomain containing protein [Tritrichomonas foetus]|eukprot:OHT07427.1 Bromodomain containing protein [Tritrichomonas foetus]